MMNEMLSAFDNLAQRHLHSFGFGSHRITSLDMPSGSCSSDAARPTLSGEKLETETYTGPHDRPCLQRHHDRRR